MNETTKVAERRLLTVNETAERLRTSRPTVYRRIAAGEIPALRIGERGPLRVDADELEAWIYQQGDAT
jgi:excisionase family DNA binding protein